MTQKHHRTRLLCGHASGTFLRFLASQSRLHSFRAYLWGCLFDRATFSFSAVGETASVEPIKAFRVLLVPFLIFDAVGHALYAVQHPATSNLFGKALVRSLAVHASMAALVEILAAAAKLDTYWSGVALFAVLLSSHSVKLFLVRFELADEAYLKLYASLPPYSLSMRTP